MCTAAVRLSRRRRWPISWARMASISDGPRRSGRVSGTTSTGRKNPIRPGSISEGEARTGIGAGQSSSVAERTILRTLAQRTIQRTRTAAEPRAQTAR